MSLKLIVVIKIQATLLVTLVQGIQNLEIVLTYDSLT